MRAIVRPEKELADGEIDLWILRTEPIRSIHNALELTPVGSGARNINAHQNEGSRRDIARRMRDSEAT